ncbi:hypothetical protein GCM10023210_31260 [Chryseobacterium ginsengisoli]|uniref:Rho termination factor N-terminal domain-containing protein n=1 Tax=Chryseobacterium ginsengisoli TaxID=363853 RepID=A0ABP9MLM9_9FLAO
MSDIKTKALEFFESKPEAKEVFATSDGFLFEKNPDAVSHSRTLDDQEIETILNSLDLDDLDEIVVLHGLKVPELKAKANQLGLPESEWKSLTKDDLIDYLIENSKSED